MSVKTAKIKISQSVARGVVYVELTACVVGDPSTPRKLEEQLKKLLLENDYKIETD